MAGARRAVALLLAGSLSAAAVHQEPSPARSRRAIAADLSAHSGVVVFSVLAAAVAELPPPPLPPPPAEPPPPPPPAIVWPGSGPMTGWFGEGRDTHRHRGIDLQARAGAPVLAAAAGTVRHAGPSPAGYAGYGTIVLIDHGGAMSTMYAHLSSVAVRRGQQVVPGDQVGAVGSTGQVTAPHLHFEVRRGGAAIDPRRWLPPR
ncbi:MAG TPA: M23 family metallopeptidase [Acidimicrobiales bacterium]|nr:M23 family metallopeptidase [Acidimicrobiales bacterium]